jgi:transposase
MEKILAPTLSPADVVVLDNLGSHLQPDLNPIEQVFAKLKHLLGKTQPLDVEATWRKVGQLIDLFSPAECANSLVNSSFGSI